MDHIGIHKKRRASGDRLSGIRQREKQLRKEVSAAAGIGSAEQTDPINLLIRDYSKTFDAVGKAKASKMSGKEAEREHKDGEPAPERQAEGAAVQNSVPAGLRKKHDFPEYTHSERALSEGSFCDRFSANAFRGGKLAGAVLEGQAKNMFITCVSRARTVRAPFNEKQRKILGATAVERSVDGQPASVMFNRDVRSAVGIAVDAVQGASRVLDIFRGLAEGTGAIQDNPLEIRDVDTIGNAYPFLSTDGDKALIQKYRQQIKALEQDNSPEAEAERQSVGSALRKAEAVLERKETEKRKFLTKLTEMQNNAREAEKLFTAEGFAETVIEEIEEMQSDVPPDDGRGRRRRTLDRETVNGNETYLSEQASAEPAGAEARQER